MTALVAAAAAAVPSPPPPRVDPDAVALALLRRFDFRHPREIKVELIAYELGVPVLYNDAASADARLVRSGTRASISLSHEARGTPRGRFSTTHELGHNEMHPADDSLERLHGAPRLTTREFRAEWEANRFASVMLVPGFLAAPLCERAVPTLDAVGELAREFNVSLTVAAKRWAELARTGCAFVESRGGVIKRAVRSSRFRGAAFERRKVEERTLTLKMSRGGEGGTRVHPPSAQRWGSGLADREVIEECVPLLEGVAGGPVLTWLWHA